MSKDARRVLLDLLDGKKKPSDLKEHQTYLMIEIEPGKFIDVKTSMRFSSQKIEEIKKEKNTTIAIINLPKKKKK